MMQLCPIALLAFPGKQAPCPALYIGSDRTYCGLMLAEEREGLEPIVKKLLGAGRGCCSQDKSHNEISGWTLEPARPYRGIAVVQSQAQTNTLAHD